MMKLRIQILAFWGKGEGTEMGATLAANNNESLNVVVWPPFRKEVLYGWDVREVATGLHFLMEIREFRTFE